MSNANSLISQVQEIIDDESFSPTQILGYLNRGVREIAGGVLLPRGLWTPPLPDLRTSASVDTSTTYPYVALPTTAGNAYHKKLFFCTSEDQALEIKIFASWVKFLKRWPYLDDTGSVRGVCVRGASLYYQGKPSTAESLTLHYFRKPVDMTEMDDEPDGIPYHLQDKLLTSFAAKEIFALIEDDDSGRRPNAAHYSSKFMESAYELWLEIGNEDGQPVYFDNETDMSATF